MELNWCHFGHICLMGLKLGQMLSLSSSKKSHIACFDHHLEGGAVCRVGDFCCIFGPIFSKPPPSLSLFHEVLKEYSGMKIILNGSCGVQQLVQSDGWITVAALTLIMPSRKSMWPGNWCSLCACFTSLWWKYALYVQRLSFGPTSRRFASDYTLKNKRSYFLSICSYIHVHATTWFLVSLT